MHTDDLSAYTHEHVFDLGNPAAERGTRIIRSVETDAAADGLVETAALLDRLMGYDRVGTALRSGSNDANAGPVLAMHFRKQDTSLRLFTTIAMLGTPQDITLQELRIECFFPLDDATADLLRSWAKVPRRLREGHRSS